MKKFQFVYDERGVSEIVASLLMILIVSTVGTVLYSYSASAFNLSWSSFQLQTDKREEQAWERFAIIAIWWDNDKQLNLTILNCGKIELAIDAVYIDGTAVTALISGRGETVTIGDIASIRFDPPVTILHGQTYEITVVSERGGKDAVYWKA